MASPSLHPTGSPATPPRDRISLVVQGDGGSIINISSIGGKLSGAGTGASTASMAAVQSLTSSAAKELGHTASGSTRSAPA
ncbi:SDR family NAD(P)-dependent oxidoreductase [Nocardioides sp. NPDC047086]|uniref:SDR family NAD(P)-dependent oxidoreductase n=1 Tax=Nocardioides sp. NPDC047086 TaxID=3154810 RepID=UPI00340B6E9E